MYKKKQTFYWNPKIQIPFTKLSQAQEDIISVLMENSMSPCSAIVLDSHSVINISDAVTTLVFNCLMLQMNLNTMYTTEI